MATREKTLSVTEARKRMFDLTERVQTPGVYFTLTERGRSRAVLMSAEEFESWMETLDILTEYPRIKKEILRSENQIREGESISLEEYKQSRSYGVSPRHLKRRAKKSR